MNMPDRRTPGDPAEDWLRTQLTAQATDIPVMPPDIARIDARRRGIHRRRAGWAACAAAVAAGAVVTAVALAGGGERREVATPPPSTLPTASSAPGTEAPTPVVPGPPGTTSQPGGTTASGNPNPQDTPRGSPQGTPQGTSGTTPTNGGTGTTGATNTIAACTPDVLGVSASKEPADATEVRHLLLTVQNAGDKPCNLYNYPHVLLGDARTTAPVIEESNADPGKPVTLAPGAEAYAAMVLNGPMDEYEVKSISLTLHGSKLGTKAGKAVDVPMPVATLYANDFQRVTYWTTAPGFALDFVMSK
ncbi:DUF4232 domain-containing protein [Streptodolium elevatio]